MKPRQQVHPPVDDLFRSRLDSIINMRHELVQLSQLIDWDYLDEQAAAHFSDEGRPGNPTRIMAGLHLLKYVYSLSDEAVCDRWLHDPYFQYFTGEVYFQHSGPIERSDMTHWRQRVGDDFCITLLQESLRVAMTTGALSSKDLRQTVVDTTVQPKAITHPTEAKLRYKAIVELGKAAKAVGIQLRQSYVRVGQAALIMSGRYRHAKQFKRAKGRESFLKVRLGRLIRDIERKRAPVSDNDNSVLTKQADPTPARLEAKLTEALTVSRQIYYQRPGDKDYRYSWHAGEVECIGKGKAHKPYEFGVKASITTNLFPAAGGQFVIHAKALPGRPYDGHTLQEILDEKREQTGVDTDVTCVDLGYRGHGVKDTKVYQSGQKRGVTKAIKQAIKRRSVVEPVIGHVKHDCRAVRNYLKGALGDSMNIVLASAGFNFRQVLRWLKALYWRYYLKALIWLDSHCNLQLMAKAGS